MSNRSRQLASQCLVRYVGDRILTVSVAAITSQFSITQKKLRLIRDTHLHTALLLSF